MPQRVVWIEGEAPRREEIRRLLEAEGLAVEEAATGAEGVRLARELRPDLTLVAAQVGDGAAGEVIAALKREPSLSGVPCVVVGRDEGERAAASAAGADGFVAAPEGRLPQLLEYLRGRRDADAGGTRARERLAVLERQGSALLHDLAHELSTPLTPIAGYLKILQSERLGPLSAQQRKAVEAMVSAVARLARIIDNLGDFANLEAGQAAITVAPVDPDALAREVVEELRDAARDARVHLEVHPSGSGPVLADRRKLRQALCNVVHNAVKFSPHGGEVLVEVAVADERLRFAVYDQGPGVAGPRQARIFEPFQHAERREEARPPGSGLGLPVARRIAEAHGGGIQVESPPRAQPDAPTHHYSGAKFLIEIPAAPAAAAADPAARLSGA